MASRQVAEQACDALRPLLDADDREVLEDYVVGLIEADLPELAMRAAAKLARDYGIELPNQATKPSLA